MLNLVGALVYLAVSVLAMRAALEGRRRARRGAEVFHWWAVALLFAGLAAWRLAEGEALVQDYVRQLASGADGYASRRAWQAPLVGLAIIAGACCAAWAFAGPRPEPIVQWSRFAAIFLLAYSIVRMVSLHALDTILYASIGPFHLNHFIDLCLAGAVGYLAIISARPRRSRRRKY